MLDGYYCVGVSEHRYATGGTDAWLPLHMHATAEVTTTVQVGNKPGLGLLHTLVTLTTNGNTCWCSFRLPTRFSMLFLHVLYNTCGSVALLVTHACFPCCMKAACQQYLSVGREPLRCDIFIAAPMA